jgi:hypothetical protein
VKRRQRMLTFLEQVKEMMSELIRIPNIERYCMLYRVCLLFAVCWLFAIWLYTVCCMRNDDDGAMRTITTKDANMGGDKVYIPETDLFEMIKKSTIQTCIIKKGDKTIISKNKTSTTNIHYKSILIDIWKTMSIDITKNSSFNFKKKVDKYHTKGYHKIQSTGGKQTDWFVQETWYVQNKDTRGTLKEIINTINDSENNLTIIKLSIELETGEIVHFTQKCNKTILYFKCSNV